MKIKSSPETEVRVLAALMEIGEFNIHSQSAMLSLSEDCFYTPTNRFVFNVIKEQFVNHRRFDMISMLDLLRNSEAAYSVVEKSMLGNYISINCLQTDIDVLVASKNARYAINKMTQALHNIENTSCPFETNQIIKDVHKDISANHNNIDLKGDTCEELSEKLLSGEHEEEEYIHIPSKTLKKALLRGLPNQSIITVAGAAGLGKTNFGTFLMHQIISATPDKQGLFFSLEMQPMSILKRYLSVIYQKNFDELDEDKRFEAASLAKDSNFTVYNPSAHDIDCIETICHTKSLETPVSVIVVDYLGLVTTKNKHESNANRLTDIARRLGILASDLNCVVIILSQINRKNTERAKDDRCPYPSDAADSSGAYHSSTLWLGIDRPETYDDNPYYRDMFVVKCRKNRFGPLFEFKLSFNNGCFKEVDEFYFGVNTQSKPTYALKDALK